MKKTLKFVLVMFIIITLLGGNTAVLAESVINEITNEESASSKDNSEKTEEPKKEAEPEEETNQEKQNTLGTENNTSEEKKDEATKKSASEEQAKVRGVTSTIDNNQPTEVNAGENNGKDEDNDNGEGESEPETQELDTSKLKGKLNLSIDLRLPQKNMSANDLTVTLKKSGLYDEGAPTKANGIEKEKQLFYTFNELPAGMYTLTISGKGYQTFTQANVEIKGNTTSELHLTNGYDALGIVDSNGNSMLGPEGEQTTKKGRTGVIGIGDVNKDGNITLDDVTDIVNNIEGKRNTEPNHNIYDYTYDLNKDGVVDIADISYAALNKGHSFIGASARFLTNIDTTKVETKAQTGAVDSTSSGTIDDILENNDKHVTLKPAKNEDISDTNPISIAIDIEEDTAETQLLSIAPSSNINNNITEGTIIVDGHNNETGKDVEIECKIGETEKETASIKSIYKVAEQQTVINDSTQSTKINYEPISGGTAKIEKDGTIVVDFGNAIAVKRVIINVTGTTSNKLADISKVEFLNGMEDKIPEPELSIPELRKADIDASITEESFMVKWNNVVNVTGYQVLVTANFKGKGKVSELFDVDGHEIKIEQFNGKSIKDLLDQDPNNDYTVYNVSVRSVNGDWYSQ